MRRSLSSGPTSLPTIASSRSSSARASAASVAAISSSLVPKWYTISGADNPSSAATSAIRVAVKPRWRTNRPDACEDLRSADVAGGSWPSPYRTAPPPCKS